MNKLINELTDREAMGLPDNMVSSKTANVTAIVNTMLRYSSSELVKAMTSISLNFEERYAAGSLLALLGDPRISVFSPDMVEIASATVAIGIPESDVDKVMNSYPNVGLKRSWILKECPRFTTHIKAFKIAKYLVTNAEYHHFLLDTGYPELPSSWHFGIYPHQLSNHPVYSVSEIAAIEYTKWLSLKTKQHYRLPREYEWEYAAGGIHHYEYPWGSVYKTDHANTLEDKVYTTTPVGMYPKGYSAFGVADMAGNVEEFVDDYYHPYPGGMDIQDDLALLGKYRIARGGSFARYGDLARISRRHGHYPKPIYALGFRVAQDVSTEATVSAINEPV